MKHNQMARGSTGLRDRLAAKWGEASFPLTSEHIGMQVVFVGELANRFPTTEKRFVHAVVESRDYPK